MHIPENYLSPSTCTVLSVAMVPVWKRAASKIKQEVTRKKMPLLGICAAFSFLIMMFNLPLPGGTTGHAVGAALTAILLGPYAAVISTTVALVVQAVFFGDGGILAIGANTFNMAFVMPFVAYYTYKFIYTKTRKAPIAAFIAGYLSLNVAAFLTAVEFGLQPLLFQDPSGNPLYGPYDLKVAIPAMMIPHLLVAGVIEGLVTAGVYGYVKKISPGLIYEETEKPANFNGIYGLIVALILLSPLGLLATGTAWGEWGTEEIKEMLGFIPKGMKEGFEFTTMMPDYTVAGLGEIPAYILSAILGIGFILILFKVISRITKSKLEK